MNYNEILNQIRKNSDKIKENEKMKIKWLEEIMEELKKFNVGHHRVYSETRLEFLEEGELTECILEGYKDDIGFVRHNWDIEKACIAEYCNGNIGLIVEIDNIIKNNDFETVIECVNEFLTSVLDCTEEVLRKDENYKNLLKTITA